MSKDLSIEELVLQNLIYNEEFLRNISPYIREDYFGEFAQKSLYRLILTYFEKYNKQPSVLALKVDLEAQEINQDLYDNCSELIDNVKDYVSVDYEWLLESTEKFCQDKAIYNAIMESIKIIDETSKKDKGSIPELLQEALAVSFDSNIGHDFLESGEERYDFYHRIEEKVPFDIDLLNTITKNGLSRKTLNVILASTGVGKTLMMCHMAAGNLMAGKNVLYITLEMSEERISERIDANLMNIPLNQLEDTLKEIYISKLDRLRNKTQGKLIVKEYPTSSVGAGHFRHLLTELSSKKNFKPDIIYIDYINLCISSRMKMGNSVNSYTYIKAIAEELRGLAVEFNLPIMSATQSNRDGANNSDIDLTNTSESWGLPATVDFMIAAIATEELESLGQIMIKQLKNRYGDLALHKRFVVGIDKSRMKLYNVEAAAQANIYKDISEKDDDTPIMDKGKFGEGLKSERWNKKTFEGWK